MGQHGIFGGACRAAKLNAPWSVILERFNPFPFAEFMAPAANLKEKTTW
jgi:hypothetical protein